MGSELFGISFYILKESLHLTGLDQLSYLVCVNIDTREKWTTFKKDTFENALKLSVSLYYCDFLNLVSLFVKLKQSNCLAIRTFSIVEGRNYNWSILGICYTEVTQSFSSKPTVYCVISLWSVWGREKWILILWMSRGHFSWFLLAKRKFKSHVKL